MINLKQKTSKLFIDYKITIQQKYHDSNTKWSYKKGKKVNCSWI